MKSFLYENYFQIQARVYVCPSVCMWPYTEDLIWMNGYVHFKFAHVLKLSHESWHDGSLTI